MCCGDGPRNLLKLAFSRAGARPFIRSWSEIAPPLLQRMQRELNSSGNAAHHELLQQLRNDPEIPAAWRVLDPSSAPPLVPPLTLAQGTLRLRLFSMISTFGTPHDITTDEIRVETFHVYKVDATNESR